MGKRANKAAKKKNQLHLVFDDKARVEFLTGFQKRKTERRKKAQEQMIQKLKDEKKKIKQEYKEKILHSIKNQRSVPEVEHLVDSQTFDFPEHSVTVTEVIDVDKEVTMLGTNKESDSSEDENDTDEKPRIRKTVLSRKLNKPSTKKKHQPKINFRHTLDAKHKNKSKKQQIDVKHKLKKFKRKNNGNSRTSGK
ncbi:nucleolar protein 12-like [Tubulanus polymorphus]|uniref:nucleolar protein 12-like n=1 Tax=Tubulanus polymorphus TaxID=672921 RepID=UPI003DA614EC